MQKHSLSWTKLFKMSGKKDTSAELKLRAAIVILAATMKTGANKNDPVRKAADDATRSVMADTAKWEKKNADDLKNASYDEKQQRLASRMGCDACGKSSATVVRECTGGCMDMICQECLDNGAFNTAGKCHVCDDNKWPADDDDE